MLSRKLTTVTLAPAIFSIPHLDLQVFPSRCPWWLFEVSLWLLRVPVRPRAFCRLRSPFLFILATSLCVRLTVSLGRFPVEPFAIPFSESALDFSLSFPGGTERHFVDFLLSVIVSGAIGVRRSVSGLSRIWPAFSTAPVFRPLAMLSACVFHVGMSHGTTARCPRRYFLPSAVFRFGHVPWDIDPFLSTRSAERHDDVAYGRCAVPVGTLCQPPETSFERVG